MAKVVQLDAYRRGRHPGKKTPPAPRAEDTILIRKQQDGTYTAHLSGEYATSPLLAVEHTADLASALARKERFR